MSGRVEIGQGLALRTVAEIVTAIDMIDQIMMERYADMVTLLVELMPTIS